MHRSAGVNGSVNWSTVKFDWNRARAFLVTAEEGSLSAAARALGQSQPTLSRKVEAFEQELGVLLFDRVGRRLILTASGRGLLEHVRAMGAAASQLSLAASGESQALTGFVSVTASHVFAARLLPPMIAELRLKHPGILLEIVASNHPKDLRRREADVAIRNFRPSDQELVAKKIRDMMAYLYASSSYLDEIGRPMAPAEFCDANFVALERPEPMIERLAPLGFNLSTDNFPLVCDNHLVQWELVREGLGIGVMAAQIGDQEPNLERILPAGTGVSFPVWLVSHQEVHKSARVRTVFDFLARAFARL